MRDVFAEYHPVVNFYYFCVILIISMCSNHPVMLTLGFLGAFLYLTMERGIGESLIFTGKLVVPVLLLCVLVNGLFNHYGITPLYYLWNGNAITLESLAYGGVMGLMLSSVILWCGCIHRVMTSDKFIYLFGRVVPVLALLLSMCLGFVPRFSRQMKVIEQAQRCAGEDDRGKSPIKRITPAMARFSILLTWALENTVDTAQSMTARGYGLKGRTSFSVFRFSKRDGIAVAAISLLLAVILFGAVRGDLHVLYNPMIRVGGLPLDIGSFGTYLAFGLLCLMPVGMEYYERVKWNVGC